MCRYYNSFLENHCIKSIFDGSDLQKCFNIHHFWKNIISYWIHRLIYLQMIFEYQIYINLFFHIRVWMRNEMNVWKFVDAGDIQQEGIILLFMTMLAHMLLWDSLESRRARHGNSVASTILTYHHVIITFFCPYKVSCRVSNLSTKKISDKHWFNFWHVKIWLFF